MCVMDLFYMHVHFWFDTTHVICFCTPVSHVCAFQVVGDLYVLHNAKNGWVV